MQGENTVTVYWTAGAYSTDQASWTHLYSEPTSLLSELNKTRNKDNKSSQGQSIFGCPSYIDALKNVYVTKNIVKSSITMPDNLDYDSLRYPFNLEGAGLLGVKVMRPPSVINTTNIVYNMSWLMFADEPLVARFTAPYFPATSPGKDVILSAGEFDIGQWFRDFNLDYHVPHSVKELKFDEDQPLFYTEFKTNKKVVLKRFMLTQQIMHFANECAESRVRYGSLMSLTQRYRLAKLSKMSNQLLTLIKQNLAE